jgi:Raf kinase inhibitor-like YbhB/YbcL family protein
MQPHAETTPTRRTLNVRSAAFGANGSIPIEHTADGADIAPPLSWDPPPPGTRSVAILVEDPDAPLRTFVHWIVVGIPPEVTELPAGGDLPEGALNGTNDAGEDGWSGPDPIGGRHRYVFRVFALDNHPNAEGMTKPDLMNAIKGHVLAQGELIGTYDKSGHTHDKSTNEADVKQVGGRDR